MRRRVSSFALTTKEASAEQELLACRVRVRGAVDWFRARAFGVASERE